MKLLNKICIGMLIGLTPLAHAVAPNEIDRVVAVVNNNVITQFELYSRVNQAIKQLTAQHVAAPPRSALENQILQRMITEQTLLQLAEETGLRVDAEQLDRALGKIAAQNKLSLPEFRTALEKEGESWESFREQIRREMIITRLREREVDNRVQITEAEIDLQLTNETTQVKEEFNLDHILISLSEGASPERIAERKTKAEKALAELRAGADFVQISAGYSDAQNAVEGGHLGYRTAAQLPTLFLENIATLKIGEVSSVLRSANGFHILRLVDKRGIQSAFVVRQTHARHILVKTNEIVNDAEARRRLTDLRERLQHGAKFAELAKLHSDDLSAGKGGDLGWLNPSDTVPEFERAMDTLKPGEISEPVSSPFGWHLIMVEERRDQDLSQERRRLEARRAIRTRKSDEAFDDWVRQARDRAFVEIRLEN